MYRGGGKDYRGESEVVTRHIRTLNPEAASLLDVGCGTGGHLRHFAREFRHAEGIDITDGMLAECRRRVPGVAVTRADMRTFRLPRRFDAIVSLFNVIGNVADRAELDLTLVNLSRHLVPGGVLVVEPWWFTENFTPGHIGSSVTTLDGRTVARVSHSVREGDTTRMRVHCIVAEPGAGLRHFTYEHVMALFSRAQYEASFARAGCPAHYVEDAYPGNGLFVAVKGLHERERAPTARPRGAGRR
ncbi:class I SAM-dependent methyltransferase [Micromonospora sp. STR1_7]|uniref:Class I SAM-dependent methyltransferase n=1 Tax=Micromonospora parastrephiae TaxID=2806101 RepID=A0ABS1XQ75_9ACTN|nr:class I SAM-dependent methyltransferase [Micromonospora parastrephiae]MBM0231402.1 class I SAM-dependent methyltransferase [Micromonospora parastrephiae]